MPAAVFFYPGDALSGCTIRSRLRFRADHVCFDALALVQCSNVADAKHARRKDLINIDPKHDHVGARNA
jgi:hypothetical protein